MAYFTGFLLSTARYRYPGHEPCHCVDVGKLAELAFFITADVLIQTSGVSTHLPLNLGAPLAAARGVNIRLGGPFTRSGVP
jgi:hypothetical protein